MQNSKRHEIVDCLQALHQAIIELEQQLNTVNANEDAQHQALDHLDEYIDAVDTKVGSLKLFWQALKQERLSK